MQRKYTASLFNEYVPPPTSQLRGIDVTASQESKDFLQDISDYRRR